MSKRVGTQARDGEIRRSRAEFFLSSLSLAGIVVLSVAVLVMTIATFGGYRFGRRVTAEVSLLFEGAPVIDRSTPHAAVDSNLPLPVRKYLRFAFSGDPFRMGRVFVRHDGEFRTGEGSDWLDVYGEQYYRADIPGFVWHARVFIVPRFFWFEARDMLVGDKAGMLVKLGSVFTLENKEGDEVFQADLLRWLAEAPLFPYAFVSENIEWKKYGPNAALASLSWRGRSVSGLFRFDSEGKVTAFEAEDRYRSVGETSVKTPWSGKFSEYRVISGVRVPTLLEAAWNPPSGELVYARFRVRSLYYDNSPR